MGSSPIKVFGSTSGINTKVDPVRLRFDRKTGISEFAAAVNIDVDDTGRPSRREGYATTARAESWHSLFGCGNYGIGVRGDALCIIEHDLFYTPIRNVMFGAHMSYSKSFNGQRDIIYYTNGFAHGRIWDKISHSWPVETYVGVPTRKAFYAAPIGHLIEMRNLRMFMAQNNVLWYSEAGSYSLWRMASSYFVFPNRLRMVQATTGGLWISDSDLIWWLGGEIFPSTMEMPVQVKMADYSAIEGTAIKATASKVGEGIPGIVVIFATTKGICIGTGEGQLINVTERKLDMPTGLTGAGIERNGKYIITID